MCGIHFVIAPAHVAGADHFMHNAFLANQVRGTDSSGVFQIKNTYSTKDRRVPEVVYFKDALCGTDFLDEKDAQNIIKSATYQRATIGHVRAATAGGIKADNAHPFLAVREDGSRIIGVHNGSLPNWRRMKDADKYEVDSAWLFSKLAADGTEAFEGFEGAYALVWFDSRNPNSLFVARNAQRPLAWAYTENGKGLMAASELGMLGWLMERNKIAAKEVAGYKFHYPEVGHIYEINLNNPVEYTKTKFADYNNQLRKYEAPRPQAPVAVVTPPVQNRSPAGSPNYTPAANSAFDQFNKNKQDKFFDEVKRVLRDARDELEAEKRGDKKKKPVEIPATNSGAIHEKNFLYCHEPNTRNVSKSEEELAKKLGIFGLVANFCGYFYDDDTGMLYGDFRTVEDGREIAYDCVLRGESASSADSKWVHPSKLGRVVVVGVMRDKASRPGDPYVIVDDLNKAKDKTLHTRPVPYIDTAAVH